jgi:hypothetical protein
VVVDVPGLVNRKDIMKRIRHNDLTHYFLRDHSTLPRAYVASCEKFFKSIKLEPLAWLKASSNKPQAASNKRLTGESKTDIG